MGDEPQYHNQFRPHAPRPRTHHLAGGTVFHFVTEGIHAALELARAAAGDGDVRLGGGIATVRECLQAGLIDELHLAVRPVCWGLVKVCLGGWIYQRWGMRATRAWRGSGRIMVFCVSSKVNLPGKHRKQGEQESTDLRT